MPIGIGVAPGFGAAGFRPTMIAGCVLWLRSDMGITVSGSNVTDWNDQSGSGNHATQGADADRPEYLASGWSNGLPAVRFDVANTEWLNLATDLGAPNSCTTFCALDFITNPSGTQFILGCGGSSATLCGRVNAHGFYDQTAFRTAGSASTGEQISTSVIRTTDGDLYEDGVLAGTPAYDGTLTWSGAQVGAAGGTSPLDAEVAEVIFYNRALSASELVRVHNYLKARYNR